MKIAILTCLLVAVLVFAGCTTEQAPPGKDPAEPTGTLAGPWTPEPTWTPQPTWTPVPTWTPEPTPRPTATPDTQATVEARIEATKAAEAELEATVEARITATKAAESPAVAPEPTPLSDDEKLVQDFFECLENNLAVAGAFTSGYDGPLSEQVQTVLNGVGDITSLMHDYGLFESAMLVAIDAEASVGLAVGAINFGCSVIGSDDPPKTPEPVEDTPTPKPTATPTPMPDDDPELSKCEELAPKIIELSQDKDPSDDPISEITGIEEISDNLLGLECKGMSHTVGGEAKWIKFHQNRLGRYGYETLEPGDHECEYMVPRIIELSQGRDQEILEINDTEELERNGDKLICQGKAKTTEGEYDIEFYLEASDDGKQSFGYELAPVQ